MLMKFASFGDYYARVVRYNKNVPNFAAFGLANGQLKFYWMKNKKSKKMNFKNLPGVVDLQWDSNSTNYILGCWNNGIV